MPRDVLEKQSVSWSDRFGTTASGNLPQHKLSDGTCSVTIGNITYPGVSAEDFRVNHKLCPYSTESSIHWTKNGEIADGDLVSHTDTNGIMLRESRGPRHGFLCVDDNCPYYITVSSGNRYFYV